jgi:hypothetical protein
VRMSTENNKSLFPQIIENPTMELFEETIKEFNKDSEKGETLHIVRCGPTGIEEAEKSKNL